MWRWALRMLLALTWVAFTGSARAQHFAFVYHDQTEGLANLTVTALAQDNLGYLWVGTDNGLYRYGGANFVRQGGLEVGSVLALKLADDGQAVWVGTSQGLFLLHEGQVQQAKLNGKPIAMQARGNLVALEGHRLLVTSVHEVLEVLPDQQGGWQVRPYFSAAHLRAVPKLDSVTSMHRRRDGTLWLACGLSLCRFHHDQVELLPTPASGHDGTGWSEFYEDRSGNLWLRSSTRLLQLPHGGTDFVDLTPPHPSSNQGLFSTPIVEDAQGRILTQTRHGLARWQQGRWETVDERNGLMAPGGATALLVDRQGGIWVGTSGRGLAQWQGYRHLSAWTARQGLGNDDVWSLLRDTRGRLHIGTSAGVWQLDEPSRRIRPELPSHLVEYAGAMVQDKLGRIWIAGFSGELLMASAQGAQPVRVAKFPMIFRLIADSQGRVWVCTQRGLLVIDPARDDRTPRQADAEVNPDPMHGPRVYAGCEATDHTLWFSTDSGLWRWDGQHLQRVQTQVRGDRAPPAAGFPVMTCAAHAAEATAWLAAVHPGGLWQLRRRGEAWEVEPIMPPHLQTLGLMGVLQDRRGWLWITTDGGVHVRNGQIWRSFNRDNGLVWNDTNQGALYEDTDGSIWVGTSLGLQHITQADTVFEPILRAPPVVAMKRGEVDVDMFRPIALAWSGPPLKLSFASPWFEGRRADRLQYRVLGLDDTWAVSAGAELTLSSLAPGDYRVEVLTENTDLQLRSPVAAVGFSILAPWWRTPSFIGLCALALIVTAWALYRWRLRQLAHRQRYLEALVAERTAELAAQREQMRQLALKDSLTGLWNRRALMGMLDAELARVHRGQQTLTLAVVDADHFKQVNDQHGHLVGDLVLKALAQRLQEHTRPYDQVGRYGGEEFLLLLPNLDPDMAEDRLRIETLHQAIGAQAVDLGDSGLLRVTCSIGVAVAHPGEQVNAEAMIALADAALYSAKNAGRNRIVYSPAPA